MRDWPPMVLSSLLHLRPCTCRGEPIATAPCSVSECDWRVQRTQYTKKRNAARLYLARRDSRLHARKRQLHVVHERGQPVLQPAAADEPLPHIKVTETRRVVGGWQYAAEMWRCLCMLAAQGVAFENTICVAETVMRAFSVGTLSKCASAHGHAKLMSFLRYERKPGRSPDVK